MTAALGWATAFVIVLGGCARPTSEGTPAPLAVACAKAGERCEYATGKIGLCTTKPDCDQGPCLTCVSMH